MVTSSPDIRMMAAKVMMLDRADMEAVVYDESLPVVVRRFADSLLRGNVKDMVAILDQTLGKPTERHSIEVHDSTPFDNMSTDELRGLLSVGSMKEGGDESETK